MASVRLVRHATLDLDFDGTRLLVDPMLGAPGDIDPIPNSPNQRPNPLVELPDLDRSVFDAVVVTHLHRDHLDDAARERLPADIPVICQPEDAEELRETFTDVRPVSGVEEFDGVTVSATPARHGTGDLAEQMGPVTGFLFDADETVYVAGDTVWYGPVADVLASHDPDLAVVNTGEAQFVEGDPITMTREGVAAFAGATDADVVAVHMEAINHCLCTRADLRDHLDAEGVENVAIPDDGATVSR
ncbi:MBL fold metallo-hydrolase [Halosegnis marinus]|uniref:MBL fold metallo-hydrolase n=1 Tax=Halosegnis marinus TaxID=3034023 RepID=A0ABD5ZST4_9EURY|nr:MBL fold metallo-hydrolase [Halosegnis sp. DT85]